MIIDSIENCSQYNGLNPLLRKAFEYIQSLDLSNLESGKTELMGTDLIVMVNDTTLKTKASARLEVHNKYIDIQIPVSRTECFGWKSRTDLKRQISSFDKERDIQFFEDTTDVYVDIPVGNFVIFFPQDAHAPCVGEGEIRKIIIKVANEIY